MPERGGLSDRPMVLLERSGVMALAKPCGLATQAPAGFPSVESWLRDRLPAGAYLGVPHRLDRAVSGVLLMATTPRAARQLSRQFERRQVTKTYVAIVAPGAAVSPVAGALLEWRDRIAKCPDAAAAAVVGDTLYGGPALAESSDPDHRRLPIALHALTIRFRDPDSAEELVVTATLPSFWPAAAVPLLPGH